MPNCNGYQAAKKITDYLQENAAQDSVPPYICLLTSLTIKDEIKRTAAKNGIQMCIQKPIFKLGVQKLLIKS